jgi:hypothetical protein
MKQRQHPDRALRFLRRTLEATCFLSCLSLPLAADSITFNLIPPDGKITGVAGSTVGWGYSITNESAFDRFVSTDLNPDSSFVDGTPFSVFDFPNLAPGASAVELFDPVNFIGLYTFTWDPTAPGADINSGNFLLSGQWRDGDPLNGGNFIADAIDTSAAYTVSLSNSNPAPEPASVIVTIADLGALAMARGRKRRNLQ